MTTGGETISAIDPLDPSQTGEAARQGFALFITRVDGIENRTTSYSDLKADIDAYLLPDSPLKERLTKDLAKLMLGENCLDLRTGLTLGYGALILACAEQRHQQEHGFHS